jgi:tagatose 6-phosphate kinase
VILCVCLNPALDVTYTVDRLEPGAAHRVRSVRSRAGGKAVNAAAVLRALGSPVTVLAPAGGPAGEVLRAAVDGTFVPVAGETRRTVTVVDAAGATLLNEPGPQLSAAEWDAVLDAFPRLAAGAGAVVLSGSLPPGVPADAYALLTRLAGPVPVLVDADGAALAHGLAAGPAVVKPNLAELGGLVTGPLRTAADVVAAARRLVAEGARDVVVSRGGDGVVAVTAAGTWSARLPRPVAGNPTGAGDALVARLALGLARGEPWPERLRDGVAVSAAAVLAPVAGEVDPAAAERLRADVLVEELA